MVGGEKHVGRDQRAVFLELGPPPSPYYTHEERGRMASTKRMDFRKELKRPYPPPSFSENHVAIF